MPDHVEVPVPEEAIIRRVMFDVDEVVIEKATALREQEDRSATPAEICEWAVQAAAPSIAAKAVEEERERLRGMLCELQGLVATVLIRRGKGYPVDGEGMPHTIYGNPMTAERGHAEKTAEHVLDALLDRLAGEPSAFEWACDSCGAIALAGAEGWEQRGPDDAGVTVEFCPNHRLALDQKQEQGDSATKPSTV